MKVHGKLAADGKRYADVWVDPDGGYLLASRVKGKGEVRMRQSPEYRLERYEVDQRGNILGDKPKADPTLQELRAKRMMLESKSKGAKRTPPPPRSATIDSSES